MPGFIPRDDRRDILNPADGHGVNSGESYIDWSSQYVSGEGKISATSNQCSYINGGKEFWVLDRGFTVPVKLLDGCEFVSTASGNNSLVIITSKNQVITNNSENVWVLADLVAPKNVCAYNNGYYAIAQRRPLVQIPSVPTLFKYIRLIDRISEDTEALPEKRYKTCTCNGFI
jgi:hypothetical protein